jgi:hypothetical protein
MNDGYWFTSRDHDYHYLPILVLKTQYQPSYIGDFHRKQHNGYRRVSYMDSSNENVKVNDGSRFRLNI